jgi:hypothetical protein
MLQGEEDLALLAFQGAPAAYAPSPQSLSSAYHAALPVPTEDTKNANEI